MLGLVSRVASRSRTMTLFPDPTPTSTTARPGAAKDRARPCSRCASRFTSKLACGIPAAGHAGSATRIPFKPSGATLTGKRPAGHPQQPKKRLNFGAISLDTERTDEATHGKAPEFSARGFSSMNQPAQPPPMRRPLCGAPTRENDARDGSFRVSAAGR